MFCLVPENHISENTILVMLQVLIVTLSAVSWLPFGGFMAPV